MKLNASEAMRGSPSSWKVLAITAKLARVKDRRVRVSVDEREESIRMVSSHVLELRRGDQLQVVQRMGKSVRG